MESNMHEFHAVLISSQTKNIHVNKLDSTLLAKSLSNSTEDYSSLKLQTCEALTQENHHFWTKPFHFKYLVKAPFKTHMLSESEI